MQPPDAQEVRLPTTIILLGASVRAAAQSARRGGFSVLGVDLFGDSDTLRACDRHELLDRSWQNEAIAKHIANFPVTTNLPIIRVGGLGNMHLDGEFQSLGPSMATILELKNPTVLARLAAESGMQVPRTFLDDAIFASAKASGRWLRKTIHSSGGTGVTWYDGSQARHPTASRNHDHPPGNDRFPSQSTIQQWVPGRNYGATFFADCDSVSLLGIFRSLFVRRGRHPFLYAGSFGPNSLSDSSKTIRDLATLQPALQRFAKVAADQFQLRGLFNIDFIVDESGNGWVLEINPRWTAASELIERRLSELGAIDETDSLMRWHILAHLDHAHWRLQPKIERSITDASRFRGATWIKQVVYADRPGVLDERRLHAVTTRSSIEFADVPPHNRVHRRGDPLLTMIGKLGPNDRCMHDNLNGIEKHQITTLRPHQWRRTMRETLCMIQPCQSTR